MRRLVRIILFFVYVNLVYGAVPGLDDGVDIGIDVGARSSPTFADWDSNPGKDMVCGQVSGGRIRLYPNIGTIGNPLFSNSSYLQAKGNDIRLPDC